jgi:hypothetical protein
VPAYHLAVKILALFLTLILSCGTAFGQQGRKDPRPQRQMNEEERQRMRDDMHDAYRDRQQQRPERPRQMSPEERAKLRSDIEETNRDLRKK